MLGLPRKEMANWIGPFEETEAKKRVVDIKSSTKPLNPSR